jgi:nitrite reductase/ring-hydroxylating ferredoxin subunit
MSDTTRRAVLAGAAGLGAAAALSACGGGSSGGTSGGGSTPDTAKTTGGATTGGAANGLAPTGDIPVGGGKVFAAEKVVVTQPTAGSFKAFTAVCTHQACTVNDVSGGRIKCPCHGSQYSISDGSVLGGPAPRPLASEPVKVENGQVVLG